VGVGSGGGEKPDLLTKKPGDRLQKTQLPTVDRVFLPPGLVDW
jgi:hypothetical protein